jgi:hypothetical protein
MNKGNTKLTPLQQLLNHVDYLIRTEQWERAAQAINGMSAEQYCHLSFLQPETGGLTAWYNLEGSGLRLKLSDYRAARKAYLLSIGNDGAIVFEGLHLS